MRTASLVERGSWWSGGAAVLLALLWGVGGCGSVDSEPRDVDVLVPHDVRDVRVPRDQAAPDGLDSHSGSSEVRSDSGDGGDSSDSNDAGGDAWPDVACEPSCGSRVCGPDGCDGSCGECPEGQMCEAGACVCAPICPDPKLGIECGPDGCGGFCSCDAADAGSFAYCDPDTRQCRTIEEDCEAGWCRIPPGLFLMGETQGYDDYGPLLWALPVHPVELTRSFAIQATEITVGAYQELLGEEAVQIFHRGCGLDCPPCSVTLFDAMRYANLLSQRDGLEPCYELEDCQEVDEWCPQGPDGDCYPVAPGVGLECARFVFSGPDCGGYRLPSEAEWEFAARAGTSTCFPNGEVDEGNWPCGPDGPQHEVAWFCGNSAVDYEGCIFVSPLGEPLEGPLCMGPRPVASKASNAFGLFDTSGNAAEFTGTLHAEYEAEYDIAPGFDRSATMGSGNPESDRYVVLRGGGFFQPRQYVCSSQRQDLVLGAQYLGGCTAFRLVRTLQGPQAPLVP